MSIELKVTPAELKKASGEVSKKIADIKAACRELGETIDKSASYWEGEASNLHREKYNKIKEDIETVISTMEHRPADLLTMAGLYDSAEAANMGLAESLQNSLIS